MQRHNLWPRHNSWPPFPGLTYQEAQIGQGGYGVINGDSNSTSFDLYNLSFDMLDKEGPFPGVYYLGTYTEYGERGSQVSLPVVSFLYHKQGVDGNLETHERMIILRGVGYGVLHPGHTGQQPAYYLIGAQIGTVDHESGRMTELQTDQVDITPKHFSMDCIVDGALDEPVLANLVKL